MKKLKVAVLFGGCSDEHKISLKSAHNIITNLDREKYDIYPVGITKAGQWMKFDGMPELLLSGQWCDKKWCTPVILAPNRDIHGFAELRYGGTSYTSVDLVFPALHGRGGEDGTIQGLLELADIPYAGCGLTASALCMDKDSAHQYVDNAGVSVTPSVVMYSYETLDEKQAQLAELKYPLFVKPASSGSSFGVSKVDTKEQLIPAIKAAFEYGEKIIIEQGVEGIEVGCSVLGNGNNLTIGRVDEIELSSGFFRVHQEKNPESGSENSRVIVPARVSKDVVMKIKGAAEKIYKALGCRGLARIDMFLTPTGDVVFNEVNSMPGFTTYSRYPRMMAASGLQMPELLDKVIALAMEK